MYGDNPSQTIVFLSGFSPKMVPQEMLLKWKNESSLMKTPQESSGQKPLDSVFLSLHLPTPSVLYYLRLSTSCFGYCSSLLPCFPASRLAHSRSVFCIATRVNFCG